MPLWSALARLTARLLFVVVLYGQRLPEAPLAGTFPLECLLAWVVAQQLEAGLAPRQLAALGLGSAFVCLSLLSSGAGTGLWALWALLLLLQGLRPVAASGPIPALSWSDRLGGALGASLLLVMLLLPAILPWDRGPSRDLADGVSPPLTGEEDDDEGCEDDDDRCEDDDDDRCEEDDDDLPLQLEPGQEAIVL